MMRRKLVGWSVTGGVALAVALGAVAAAGGSGGDRGKATAVLRNAAGDRVGTVHMRLTRRSRVTMRVAAASPGFHGWHVHAVGQCDPQTTDPSGAPAPFLSAGGHLNPTAAGHGAHAADLPPMLVGADGTASMSFVTDRLTRRELFDLDGSAVIVHAGSDNLGNIPARYTATGAPAPGPDAATVATGDAGARFACGVLTRR